MRSILLLSSLFAVTACSPFSPDLGSNPFQCEPDSMKCPSGYTCQDDGTGTRMVCVQEGGVIVDAPPSGFQCANDSNIEGPMMNDTIANAYVTGIADSRKMIDFAGLAICPEGDKDTYLINTNAANQNIEVTISWDSGLPLSGAILGGGGAIARECDGERRKVGPRVSREAPLGTYYAQVFGGATTKNNYSMKIVVTP